MMKTKIMGFSSPGKRGEQQDSYRYQLDNNQTIAVVCDGMGGLKGGDMARRYATNCFLRDCLDNLEDCDVTEFLNQEIVRLDDSVFQLRSDSGERLGAGTTIVAVILQENKLHWMSAGDSKLYIYRNRRMRCMTREHNYHMVLDEMLEERAISEDSYEEESKRGEGLISYLGMGNIKAYDVNQNPFDVGAGDCFLLCSDGLYKSIPEDVIEEMFLEYEDDLPAMVSIMQEMIDGNDIENQDNATMLLITLE